MNTQNNNVNTAAFESTERWVDGQKLADCQSGG